jgi:predicted negative regulator of RcsB-dependent stress response
MDASAPEEALKWLQAPTVPEFAGLVADRLGDVYLAQGKKAEARAEFEKAYQLLEAGTEYRQLVEVKLNALGVDPKAAAPAVVTK